MTMFHQDKDEKKRKVALAMLRRPLGQLAMHTRVHQHRPDLVWVAPRMGMTGADEAAVRAIFGPMVLLSAEWKFCANTMSLPMPEVLYVPCSSLERHAERYGALDLMGSMFLPAYTDMADIYGSAQGRGQGLLAEGLFVTRSDRLRKLGIMICHGTSLPAK